jgi:predicted transcriptional regulator
LKYWFAQFLRYLCRKDSAMKTITLEYDERNKSAKQMIDVILSLGLATRKKTGLEMALEDVDNGKVTTIHTPKNRKTA